MPELPEVETLRRGLQKNTAFRYITEVTVANAKVLKNQPEAVFKPRLLGCQIMQVRRRGKYLLFDLHASSAAAATSPSESLPLTLCVHLKMRGQLRVETTAGTGEDEAQTQKYLCVTLVLDNGAAVVRFYDAWTWGEMRVLTPGELQTEVPALGAMGCEPLFGGPWDAQDLKAKLQKRSGPIKPILLDQTIVAGVGNIYADESLFRAGIHPERAGKSLTNGEAERLVDAVRAVLHEAVDGGGTTSEEFGDVAGQAGQYVPRVYDRGGLACVVCGEILTKIRLGGRGTVFCSSCQR